VAAETARLVPFAPTFTPSEPLAHVMNAWTAHYRECATCASTEWYEPDMTALCGVGARLFQGWVRGLPKHVLPVRVTPKNGNFRRAQGAYRREHPEEP